jgi:ATP-dependent 26S proteasome regulatory subunit
MDEIITAKSFNTQLLGIYQNNIDISKHSTENVKDSPMREGTREILPRNEATKRKNTPLKERTKKIKLDSDPSSKWPTPKTKFADLGGIESIAEDLMQLIGMPLRHPEIYRHLGVDPPRGILLHGPPGILLFD